MKYLSTPGQQFTYFEQANIGIHRIDHTIMSYIHFEGLQIYRDDKNQILFTICDVIYSNTSCPKNYVYILLYFVVD